MPRRFRTCQGPGSSSTGISIREGAGQHACSAMISHRRACRRSWARRSRVAASGCLPSIWRATVRQNHTGSTNQPEGVSLLKSDFQNRRPAGGFTHRFRDTVSELLKPAHHSHAGWSPIDHRLRAAATNRSYQRRAPVPIPAVLKLFQNSIRYCDAT
jgi:hypothetical protein